VANNEINAEEVTNIGTNFVIELVIQRFIFQSTYAVRIS